jgi:hypothetical protein
MSRFAGRSTRRLASACLLVAFAGCAPTIDVAGVYFPGWLVSIVAGIAVSYGIVVSLSRRSETRSLSESGLLFLSLAVGIALAIWLVAFSGT